MIHNPKAIFAAACMGMLLFGVSMISLGSCLPEIAAKLQLSQLQGGGLASTLPLGILAGSVLFGLPADRFGFKGLLLGCCVLVMAGLQGIAFGSKLWEVQLSVFLIGAGGGALNGATNALVADTSTGNKGANLSLLGVFFGLGALGMPVLLALLTRHFSREYIIAGIGWAIMPIVLYIALLVFPQPKQKQGFPLRQGLKLIKNTALLMLSLLLFVQSGLEGLLSNWTTSYLQFALDISTEKALWALTVYMAALTAMRLLLGALLRRFSSFAILLGGCLLGLAGCLLLWQTAAFLPAMLAFGLLGMGFSGVFPIVLGKIGERWASLSGTAFSIALTLALFGNIGINYLIGVVAHYYDLSIFPLLLLLCMLLFVLAVLATRPLFSTSPKSNTHTSPGQQP